MVFRYRLKANWPPLAWIAHCPTEGGAIDVLHGSRVETHQSWFCEAVWAGDFPAGDFDQTDIVAGTGGRGRDGMVVFVSSGSTVDRLQYFLEANGLWISNSLSALLSTIGAHVDPTYPHYPWDFHTIVKGLHVFKREIDTSRGPVRLVYFHNVLWDNHKVTERPKPNAVRDFSSFDRYYAFLTSAMQAVAENARDAQRAHPYELLCGISNGLDSPAVAVLARRAGCSKALSFDVSREGTDDSGARIGQLLGIETTVISRDAWRRMPLAEVPFIAGAAGAGEVLFKGAESALGGTVLLTGMGRAWETRPDESENLVRRDACGLCLTEYRLHVGFLHCPVAFWGARQVKDISAISRSEELKPWDIPGERNKPICRRIVEEAGVPREWFGRGKRGVSVHLFRPRQFLEPKTMEDYFRWSAKNADEWKKRGRIRPRPSLARAFDFVLVVGIGALGLMLRISSEAPLLRRSKALAGFLRAIEDYLTQPLYIRRYTFPWAVARTQELYRSDRQPDLTSAALTSSIPTF